MFIAPKDTMLNWNITGIHCMASYYDIKLFIYLYVFIYIYILISKVISWYIKCIPWILEISRCTNKTS